MREVPLIEFAREHGHTKAAALLGVTQGAISKALRNGRDVVVTCHANGKYTARETKPFPAQASRLAS